MFTELPREKQVLIAFIVLVALTYIPGEFMWILYASMLVWHALKSVLVSHEMMCNYFI